eukprot:2255051-Amphidinium_carterae.2
MAMPKWYEELSKDKLQSCDSTLDLKSTSIVRSALTDHCEYVRSTLGPVAHGHDLVLRSV